MHVVHSRLRDALDLTRESIHDQQMANPPTRELLLYCWGFCAALTGHHTSENRALFPRLVDHRPALAPVIAQLVQDHNMIEHLIGGLQNAIERDVPVEEKLRHLDGIDAVMQTHFRYEERRLLDVLDSMSDDAITAAELFGPLA